MVCQDLSQNKHGAALGNDADCSPLPHIYLSLCEIGGRIDPL